MLVYALKGFARYNQLARDLKAASREANRFILYGMFTTLTNVNFNAGRFVPLLQEAAKIRDQVREAYERASSSQGKTPYVLGGPAAWQPASDLNGPLAQARDYTLGRHNSDALPAHPANGTLMCRTTPCSDLRIDLPCHHAKILFHPVPRRATEIVALEPVAENTVRLELRLDADSENGVTAEFEPGQFMELELPDSEERRAYSLANTSNWEGRLEFLIRLQPNGVFSNFLSERARTGTRRMVRGAMGGFGIQQGSLRPRWFVAGGTGLAPTLSMLRRLAKYQELQEARLFFDVNRESELFAPDYIEQIKDELRQLKVEICVWRPEGAWNGAIGTPADAMRKALGEAAIQPDIYVCGPRC